MIQFSAQSNLQTAPPRAGFAIPPSPRAGHAGQGQDSIHFGGSPGNFFKSANSKMAAGLILQKIVPFISRISFFVPPIGTCLAILALPVVMFCDWLGEKWIKEVKPKDLTGVWVPAHKMKDLLENAHQLKDGELIQTSNHLIDEALKTKRLSASKGLIKDFLNWIRPTEQNFIGKAMNAYSKFRVKVHGMIQEIKLPKVLVQDGIAGKVTRSFSGKLFGPIGRFFKRATVGAPLPLRLLGWALVPMIYKSIHHAQKPEDQKDKADTQPPPEPKK